MALLWKLTFCPPLTSPGSEPDLVLTFPRGGWGALLGVIEQDIDLGKREAGELKIELHVNEGLQLDRQDIPIPAGVLRKLVVSDHIRPPLGVIEVRQPERRDAFDAKELRCLDPAMTGNDLVLIADEDRIRETEALDASGNLLDLFLGVGASVFGVGTQVPDAHGLNGHMLHDSDPSFGVKVRRRQFVWRRVRGADMQSAPEPFGWGAAICSG